MEINLDENLFQDLWPYIIDDKVTDIKWNGNSLFIDGPNISHQRAYTLVEEADEDGNIIKKKQPVYLDPDFVDIFTSQIANMVNCNFNVSEPSLQAETPELRFQALHKSITGNHTTSFAIRKTPGKARLNDLDLVAEGYMNEFIEQLLPCLIRIRCSGIITGDVGAGKTELEKWLAQFIPTVDGIVTVEDTLEMKLKKLFPDKDVISIKTSDICTNKLAIKMALRLNTKWLILAETRGDDVVDIIEGASTGCRALTTIHAENVWNIPDRIVTMAGEKAVKGFENSVYNFFDFAIKVKADRDRVGTVRSIDQICFFERTDEGENKIIRFIEDGLWTGNDLPKPIYKRIKAKAELNKKYGKEGEINYEDIFLKNYEKQRKAFKEYKEKNEGVK